VTQDLPIRKLEWEGSIELPSGTCFGGRAVPLTLASLEMGFGTDRQIDRQTDSSLFVLLYSDWSCELVVEAGVLCCCNVVWVWAGHMCVADGEMLLIVSVWG
jgi:hypothetical protein